MTHITVVGSFAVGLTIRTDQMPVFGQTILGSDFDFGPGGKGSNQAVGVARLGGNATLVTCLGTDELAAVADKLYAAEGVDTRYIERTDQRATGAGIIILNAEARTILNPAPATKLPQEIFAHVDYLTPNESELRILMGLAPDDPSSTRDLALALRERGVGTVVVTLGGKGALILSKDHDMVVPTRRVDVVDTTGAGDAFNAGFAVALGEGRAVEDAVAYGAACGAHACTRLGVIPSLATRAELEAAWTDVNMKSAKHKKGTR